MMIHVSTQNVMFGLVICRGLFCIVCWVGLPSAIIDPNILSKGVETSPAAAQLGLACAQTMPRLPGVCIWQVKLFQMSYGRQI